MGRKRFKCPPWLIVHIVHFLQKSPGRNVFAGKHLETEEHYVSSRRASSNNVKTVWKFSTAVCFHRRVVHRVLYSTEQLGTSRGAIVQLQVELSRYLPGSSLLAASLLGSQFGLCLPASRWNFTNLEGSISFNENGNCTATWQEVACLSLWVQQTLSTVWALLAFLDR